VSQVDTSSAAIRAAATLVRPTSAGAAKTVDSVRPADITKPRFEVGDQDASSRARAAARQFSPDNDDSQQEGYAQPEAATGRSSQGLVGALTSFVAKLLGQTSQSEGVPPSSVLAGARAYASASNRGQAVASEQRTEVVSPFFPRLSSGRVLDLNI
jgi:hypothetical protein